MISETGSGDVAYKPLPSGPSSDPPKDDSDKEVGRLCNLLLPSSFLFSILITTSLQVSILENVCWKELGLLCFVWIAFLVLQITKVIFPLPFFMVQIFNRI